MNTKSEFEKATQLDLIDPVGIDLGGGLSYEKMVATYFDKDALLLQPQTVYRLNGSSGGRYYYIFDEAGEPVFFSSMTTMIKNTLPTSEELIKWIAENGYEKAGNIRDERADYGTFLHIELGSLLINRRLDLDTMSDRLKAYIEQKRLPVDFIYNLDELKKDVLAFAQFILDHNVKPLAIEIILVNPEDGVAGAIDLVCEMDIETKGYFGEVYKSGVQKGRQKETKGFKRIIGMLDFKSGRKGFFEAHEIQLKGYSKMWNLHFPSIPVERFFNWSPKAWRGQTPTYNLKDQTESKNLGKYPYLVSLERENRRSQERKVIVLQGEIKLENRNLSENYFEIEVSELVKQKRKEEG